MRIRQSWMRDGVEPAAAALDPLFAAANVWNGLNVPFLITGADVNPSRGGLVDSTGAATGIGFSIQEILGKCEKVIKRFISTCS